MTSRTLSTRTWMAAGSVALASLCACGDDERVSPAGEGGGGADAAARIVRGFARGVFEIHFPRRFTGFLKLLSMLPDRLYFGLIARSTGL